MDVSPVVLIGLIVVTIVEVVKEKVPGVSGNVTRLLALILGGLIGALFQFGVFPGMTGSIVMGIVAGVGAVGTSTLASMASGK